MDDGRAGGDLSLETRQARLIPSNNATAVGLASNHLSCPVPWGSMCVYPYPSWGPLSKFPEMETPRALVFPVALALRGQGEDLLSPQ